MSETPPQTAARALTLVASDGPRDVVVDENLTVADLQQIVYPDRAGSLVEASGSPLAGAMTLAQARVGAGSVLVLVDPGALPARPGGGGARTVTPVREVSPRHTPQVTTPPLPVLTPGGGSSRAEMAALGTGRAPAPVAQGPAAPSLTPARVTTIVLGAALAGLAGIAGLAGPAGTPWGYAAAALLIVGGLVIGQASGPDGAPRHLAPALGAGGGAVLGTTLLDNSGAIALVGACAGAALVALGSRTASGPDRQVPLVWAWFAAGLGALSLWALATGAALTSIAALSLAAVTLVARVLPTLVIDVDDSVLLDLDRLSVTSWSPRERRRAPRYRWRIDNREVSGLVRTGQLTQTGTLVGVLVVAAASSTLLGVAQVAALDTRRGVLLAAAALALTLMARSFRRWPERVLLRLAGIFPAVALIGPLASRIAVLLTLAIAVGCVLVALGLSRLAGPVARGYSSLGAGRAADTLESLGVVLVLPAAIWACGFLEWAQTAFR